MAEQGAAQRLGTLLRMVRGLRFGGKDKCLPYAPDAAVARRTGGVDARHQRMMIGTVTV